MLSAVAEVSHPLRCRTDETELHVLGLRALFEVIGHWSKLPEAHCHGIAMACLGALGALGALGGEMRESAGVKLRKINI